MVILLVNLDYVIDRDFYEEKTSHLEIDPILNKCYSVITLSSVNRKEI